MNTSRCEQTTRPAPLGVSSASEECGEKPELPVRVRRAQQRLVRWANAVFRLLWLEVWHHLPTSKDKGDCPEKTWCWLPLPRCASTTTRSTTTPR